MKQKKSILNYFNKRKKAINALLAKPDNRYEAKYFHDLRVEIKKVRALAVMLESSAKKFNSSKAVRPIKKIFDQAGKVRELQLELAMIRKHDPSHSFRAYPHILRMKTNEEIKKFSLLHNKSSRVKKTFSQITPAIKNINKGDLNHYVRKGKNQIAALVKTKQIKAKKVHELRKSLKKLYYNLKSLHQADNSKPYKNGEALQELMGQWHDKRVMNRHLIKAADANSAGPVESDALMQIADKLFIQSRMLNRKINKEKKKQLFVA